MPLANLLGITEAYGKNNGDIYTAAVTGNVGEYSWLDLDHPLDDSRASHGSYV